MLKHPCLCAPVNILDLLGWKRIYCKPTGAEKLTFLLHWGKTDSFGTKWLGLKNFLIFHWRAIFGYFWTLFSTEVFTREEPTGALIQRYFYSVSLFSYLEVILYVYSLWETTNSCVQHMESLVLVVRIVLVTQTFMYLMLPGFVHVKSETRQLHYFKL